MPLRILIVDDSAMVRRAVRDILENHIEGLEFCPDAHNGQEGLETLLECKPDLIILDVMMPRISGYEVARRIRERHSLTDLPIVMLTARNQPGDVEMGLVVGANDYLTKPFDRGELVARVRTLVALKRAAVEQAKLQSLHDELKYAHKIQQSILPHTTPQMEGLSIHVTFLPMALVGGDFYDFHMLDPRHLGILMTDVSGHGIPAAIVSSMVKVAFSQQRELAERPAELLEAMNRILKENGGHLFLTACYLYLDLDRRELVHVNAGHNPLLVYHRSQGVCRYYKPRGKIMGWLHEMDLETQVLPLEKGDRVVLYTDGLVEVQNNQGEMFDFERFLEVMEEQQHLPAAELSDYIFRMIRTWSNREEWIEDDLILMIIDITE